MLQNLALDKLSQRLQKFHEKVCDAAALSTSDQPSNALANFESESDLFVEKRAFLWACTSIRAN